MGKISLFVLITFLLLGVAESYAQLDIQSAANQGDETWFLTEDDGCAVFNKKTHLWTRKSSFESPMRGFWEGCLNDKWLFVPGIKYDRKTGEKKPFGDFFAHDARYIYLIGSSRYVLKDNTIIPGHLDGEYHIIYSFQGNKALPVDETVSGRIFEVKHYFKDGDTDWYIADYKKDDPDSSKIKMDYALWLLIKIDNSTGKKEVIEGVSSIGINKIFRDGDYLIYGSYKINIKTWERLNYKDPHGYFIGDGSDGFWYYANSKIVNYDRDFKLNKEYGDFSYGNFYDDGEIIWIIEGTSKSEKVHGLNKATGERYDYTFHSSPSQIAKDILGYAAWVVFGPVLFIIFIINGHGPPG